MYTQSESEGNDNTLTADSRDKNKTNFIQNPGSGKRFTFESRPSERFRLCLLLRRSNCVVLEFQETKCKGTFHVFVLFFELSDWERGGGENEYQNCTVKQFSSKLMPPVSVGGEIC